MSRLATKQTIEVSGINFYMKEKNLFYVAEGIEPRDRKVDIAQQGFMELMKEYIWMGN